MAESDDANSPGRRDEEHDRWLEMQSAYGEYKSASEALESADQSIDDSPTSELVRLGVLERQQRVAFEHYLEARINFLEFRHDEATRPDAAQMALPVPDTGRSGTGYWFAIRRRILPGVAIMLLCAAALWSVGEHKQVRDLQAARDELRAELLQTRKEIQLLAQQQAASGPLQYAALPKMQQTSWPSVTRHRSAGRKSPGAKRLRRQPALHAQHRQPRTGSASRKSGA
jgi:hypothetical protein